MMVQMLGLLCIECGCWGGAALLKRRNEETIPMTCMGMVLLMFLFGIAGHLRLGAYAVLAALTGTAAASTVYCLKHKTLKESLGRFITGAGVFFIAAYGLLTVLNYSWRAYSWDELSHWADVVKAMSMENVLSTDPAAKSMFQSYPPAMALFQYFFQVLTQFKEGARFFSEWRLIFAYQLFSLALVMPFLGNVSLKKPLNGLFRIALVVLSLTIFASPIFHEIYIDCFVGILAGTAFAHLLKIEKLTRFDSVLIGMTCAVLILSKDVGMYFAVFIVLACGARWMGSDKICSGNAEDRKRALKKTATVFVALCMAVFVPKALWKINIAANHASQSFHNPYDLGVILDILLGRDTTYRASIFPTYLNAFLTAKVSFEDVGIALPDVLVCALLLLGAWGISTFALPQKQDAARFFRVVLLMTVMYILSLPLIYIFQFAEYEAVRLASMSRYLNIVWVCLSMTIALAGIAHMDRMKTGQTMAIAACVLCLTSWSTVKSFVSREYIETAKEARMDCDIASEQIREKIGDREAAIALIVQESNGYERYMFRYCLRPYTVDNEFAWSIGEEPRFDGDIWTTIIAPEDWKRRVLEEYDYVYLYKTDAYFVSRYLEFFSNDIRDKTLYIVDKNDKMCYPI